MNYVNLFIDNSVVRLYQYENENYYDIFIRANNGVDIIFSVKLPVSTITKQILNSIVKILDLKVNFRILQPNDIENRINIIKGIFCDLDMNNSVELFRLIREIDMDDYEIISPFLFSSEPDLEISLRGKKF